MYEVLLIYPPFGAAEAPAVGLSNLKAVLEKNNIWSKVIYANLIFRDLISKNIYNTLSYASSKEAMWYFGEFVFADEAFPTAKNKHKLLEEKFHMEKAANSKLIANFEILNKVNDYLRGIRDLILSENPKIVGFSTTYQQTCASVAIARYIKEVKPEIVTVLGGFNCNQPMADVLKNITPSIDYIFSGEGEDEFLQFVQNGLEGKWPSNKIIECGPIQDLNSIPYPDFTDFFEYITITGYQPESSFEMIRIPFESSRGCNWGRCNFCGQNTDTTIFREKASFRIEEELKFLGVNYPGKIVAAVDTVLPPNAGKAFRSFKKPASIEQIAYQLRSTVSFLDLKALKNSGITICHPGIENLNDNILKLMNKGTSVLNNLRLMRDCRRLDIFNFWNFLYGVPCETEEDYEETINLIPMIHHLRPPSEENQIEIMRYSPFQKMPLKYNIENLRVKGSACYIYPDTQGLEEIALYFEGDYPIAFDNQELKTKFFNALAHWKELWTFSPPELKLVKSNEKSYLIEDSRLFKTRKEYKLNSSHFQILEELEVPVDSQIVNNTVTTEHKEREFADLVSWGCIIKISDKYLSLVIL